MELTSIKSKDTNNEQALEYACDLIPEKTAREIAMLAIICAFEEKENDDYASGPEYPNMPFGD